MAGKVEDGNNESPIDEGSPGPVSEPEIDSGGSPEPSRSGDAEVHDSPKDAPCPACEEGTCEAHRIESVPPSHKPSPITQADLEALESRTRKRVAKSVKRLNNALKRSRETKPTSEPTPALVPDVKPAKRNPLHLMGLRFIDQCRKKSRKK